MHRASLVVAHASVLTDGLREHANVIFPAESSRREGGHGRAPGRPRPAPARRHRAPGRRPRQLVGDRRGRQARRARHRRAHELDGVRPARPRGPVLRRPDARGDRRARRPLAGARGGGADSERRSDGDGGPAHDRQVPALAAPPQNDSNGGLRVGTYRPIWASPEVEISPALQYTIAHQQIELSPADAQRLGIASGETVRWRRTGPGCARRPRSAPACRPAPHSSPTGIAEDSANELTEPFVEVTKS